MTKTKNTTFPSELVDEMLFTVERATFFFFHVLFLQRPNQFFHLLDFLYQLAFPPFLGQEKTAVVQDCQHLFYVASIGMAKPSARLRALRPPTHNILNNTGSLSHGNSPTYHKQGWGECN